MGGQGSEETSMCKPAAACLGGEGGQRNFTDQSEQDWNLEGEEPVSWGMSWGCDQRSWLPTG